MHFFSNLHFILGHSLTLVFLYSIKLRVLFLSNIYCIPYEVGLSVGYHLQKILNVRYHFGFVKCEVSLGEFMSEVSFEKN